MLQANRGHATLRPRQSLSDGAAVLKQKPDSPNSVLIDADSTAAGVTVQPTAISRAHSSVASERGSLSPISLAHMCQQTQHVLASSKLACGSSPPRHPPQQPDAAADPAAHHRRPAAHMQSHCNPNTPQHELYSGKVPGLIELYTFCDCYLALQRVGFGTAACA